MIEVHLSKESRVQLGVRVHEMLEAYIQNEAVFMPDTNKVWYEEDIVMWSPPILEWQYPMVRHHDGSMLLAVDTPSNLYILFHRTRRGTTHWYFWLGKKVHFSVRSLELAMKKQAIPRA